MPDETIQDQQNLSGSDVGDLSNIIPIAPATEETHAAQAPGAEVAPSVIAPEEVTAPAETKPALDETITSSDGTKGDPAETTVPPPGVILALNTSTAELNDPTGPESKKKLRVGETKAPKIEVDRKQFAKLIMSMTHGYTHMYTGLSAVRVFAQMAGVTSGNYEEECAFHSKMLDEASQ